MGIFTLMSNLSHPISLLKEEWVSIIRSEAAQAEKHGKLTRKQLNLIYEQEWFKILIPTIYGGKQMPLHEVLQLEEALSCADGSVGWVVTLCAGAGWFGGFIESVLAEQILKEDKVCVAGSGALGGTAERTEDGYLVNGKWKYATGAAEAAVFTGNCTIMNNGIAEKEDSGGDKTLSFIFLKEEVAVSNTWNAMGMIATGSQTFSAKNLQVAGNRSFEIGKDIKVNGTLYNYPFRQLAEATLAVNLSGMSFHFMDLCEQFFAERSKQGSDMTTARPQLIGTYESYRQKLQQARQKLYYAVDMSWQICAANKEVSASVLYKVTASSFALAKVVRESTSTLYQYCGLAAIDKDSEINRVFRNIYTAGQHSLLVGDGSI